jgi:hypothetical protein
MALSHGPTFAPRAAIPDRALSPKLPVMNHDRTRRGLEGYREELRKTCAARNRSALHHWALQLRDRREWLKRYLEAEPPEIHPRR